MDAAVTVIEAKGLVKRYGAFPAVDGIDVEVRAGECWGLLGPNGAGKTTFLRMVIGATPPTAGRLWVLGHDIPRQAVAMRRRIGVVPQKDNLDVDFTVAENLYTFATYFGLPAAAVRDRVAELLAFAALESRRDAYINTLSGGMQRRLSLVRALINAPELLILDEPTTGLDPQARQVIWQRLRALRAQGMTLVLTTHYMEEAQRLCDRITVMDHGRILDTDRPEALVRKYVEPHVVEVYGPGLDAWRAQGEALAERCEAVGETAFYYACDEQPLLAALQHQPGLTYLHRPANLEDVFVRLTGRELRD
ncbi:MAG: ATP-binding cassette domain-containing protein [Pseudomonadota bacterium]|nr:ATP-binding cassette domain-containing protein [Pseudomonadota bacterium]